MRVETSPCHPIPPRAERSKVASADAPSPGVVVSDGVGAVGAAAERASSSVTARLDALKGAIERGSYQVDLGRLAGRIVDDERERAGAGR